MTCDSMATGSNGFDGIVLKYLFATIDRLTLCSGFLFLSRSFFIPLQDWAVFVPFASGLIERGV